MTTYVRVARVAQVPPGRLRRVEVDGRLYCLANVGGALYALDDDCPHIGAALSDGTLEGCVLTCPLHLARFDVTNGAVVRGPAREDVRTYPVRVEGDAVSIAVGDEET